MNKRIQNDFDREKHVFKYDIFDELINDTISFFNGTPVYPMPPTVHFSGTGVYALYYVGDNHYYKSLFEKNRIEFSQPIYVGKAVPSGWRQGRYNSTTIRSFELCHRLREHSTNICQVGNLNINCRFIILEQSASDLIGTVEAALIRLYKPIWNYAIDGFGNHDPGKGRYQQAKSDWDILHPGREWAEKCKGLTKPFELIEKKVSDYFINMMEDEDVK